MPGLESESAGCGERWVSRLKRERIVVILRGDHRPADVIAIAEVLQQRGLGILEVTMNSPHAEACIRSLAGMPGLAVGAGTVLDADSLERAILAGAQFAITPHTDPDLIEAATAHELSIIVGALTPTEILTAWRAGAAAVKVFPAHPGGPEYVRSLRGPLDQIPLIPTGGVDATNARAFLGAGAVGVAVGGWLVPGTRDELDLGTVSDRARSLAMAVQQSADGGA